MADGGDLVEFHEQVGDEIRFVIADPDRQEAWISAPEADACQLDRYR